MSIRIQSLSQNSIYHDGSRIEGANLQPPDSALNAEVIFSAQAQPNYRQITKVNAENRPQLIEGLYRFAAFYRPHTLEMSSVCFFYRALNDCLGELSKTSLDQFIKSTQRLLMRGTNSIKSRGTNRVNLTPNVLLEILYGAYFAIYNGLQLGGSQVQITYNL